jgi:hypothetical protein
MNVQIDTTSSMNDSGTCSKTDTRLTHGCSLDVLESDLASILSRRPTAPPLARTILEQVMNYRKHTERRDAMRPGIARNIDRLLGR